MVKNRDKDPDPSIPNIDHYPVSIDTLSFPISIRHMMIPRDNMCSECTRYLIEYLERRVFETNKENTEAIRCSKCGRLILAYISIHLNFSKWIEDK